MEICTKLCCGLVSLLSVSSALGARTDCAHCIPKECEPRKAAGTLEGGTGNQIGEMIGKNVSNWGEKVKGTIYLEEKLAAEMQNRGQNILF